MTKAQLEAQNRRMEKAIRWALGEIGDFPGKREEGQGNFWWRHELQKRAGFRWDFERQRYVTREAFASEVRR